MAGGAPARLTRVREPAVSPRELRSFALTVGAAFVALAALLYWRGRIAAAAIVAGAGVALVLAGLIAPAALGPVYRTWMALALAISRVTTPLFMALVYFGVLTPIALAMRVVGKRPLARSRDATTYWTERPPSARRSDLRRQF